MFRRIHSLRRSAQELQEQLDRIPRQQKVQEAKAARQEELLREAHEAIKKCKVTAQKKEGDLKEGHERVARHQRQLNEAKSMKEYEALRHEITAEKAACGRLEDEVLTAMMEAEERTAQLPELEQAVKQAKEECSRVAGEAGGRQADLRGQLEEVQRKLKEAEADIPSDFRTQYNRVVASRGADALSSVRDRACSACHTEITVQSYHDLVQEMLVTCKSCGRILYLPEEAVAQ
jgi:predicted  nucleic acid-binding Zn-ribbon protein